MACCTRVVVTIPTDLPVSTSWRKKSQLGVSTDKNESSSQVIEHQKKLFTDLILQVNADNAIITKTIRPGMTFKPAIKHTLWFKEEATFTYGDNTDVISVRVGGSSPRTARPTCVFGPLQDGRDLVALLGFADPVAGRRADADGVQVGLHPAQKRRGGGGAVRDLEVHAVGLRDTNRSDGGSQSRNTSKQSVLK